jgi:hypothetical protein
MVIKQLAIAAFGRIGLPAWGAAARCGGKFIALLALWTTVVAIAKFESIRQTSGISHIDLLLSYRLSYGLNGARKPAGNYASQGHSCEHAAIAYSMQIIPSNRCGNQLLPH